MLTSITNFLGVSPFEKFPNVHQNEGPEAIKEVVRSEIGPELLDSLANELRQDTLEFLRYTGRSPEIWPQASGLIGT